MLPVLDHELFDETTSTLVRALLSLARETEQPVRNCMLGSIAACVRSLGLSYYPYLKDTLRL